MELPRLARPKDCCTVCDIGAYGSCLYALQADSDASDLHCHAVGRTAQLALLEPIIAATTVGQPLSIDTSDEYGQDEVFGGWILPPPQPGQQESFGSNAGHMEQRADEAGAIPLQADCVTTRPLGSGPTR
jgi:hypothetical protein